MNEDILVINDDKSGFKIKNKIEQEIIDLKYKIKILNDKEELLKRSLLEVMREKNIIKIDTTNLHINYIAPTTKEIFNGKELRKDNPILYDKYINIVDVRDSIKIRVKNEKL